jgi:hypothetical protein
MGVTAEFTGGRTDVLTAAHTTGVLLLLRCSLVLLRRSLLLRCSILLRWAEAFTLALGGGTGGDVSRQQ